MTYSLKLAWRNIIARPIQTVTTVLVVALAIALFVTVTLLNDALQRGIVRASDPFGMLVVGPKGSAQQLVLSTLLLQGNPVGLIPQRIHTELAADPRVSLAVPLAMGDNVGGARIIGTDQSLLELRRTQAAPPAFQLAAGQFFAADHEAVLGSKAATSLNLRIGDQFVASHGVTLGLADDVHDMLRYTVVGVLQPTETAYDNAVFTSVRSVLAAHDEHAEAPTGLSAGDEHQDEAGSLTAILVKPVGFVEQNQLWQEFYTGVEAQAVFPGRELGGLFDLLNQAQGLLAAVGYLAAIMAALTLFLAIYSAAGTRELLLAIMRGLGASRNLVVWVVIFEALLAATLGALLGRLLGYAVAGLLAANMAQQSAIPISIRFMAELEPLLWLLPLALGVLAGLVPAWQAYRVNAVKRLFAT